MCDKCDSICPLCEGKEICRRIDAMIAQNNRICDLLERQTGYDNIPLFGIFTSPIVNTDYQLPFFESGCIIQDIIVSTDATAVNLGVYIYHRSIVTQGNRQQIAAYQGTGTFPPVSGKITMPALGLIGVRFGALTGGTFVSLMASYSRSEQTGIEFMRSQRAGRIG